MINVGTDIVEISRIESCLRRENFLKRVFGTDEIKEITNSKKMNVCSIAGRFCAKEAFLKSCGKGLNINELKDIQILHKDSGEPYFKFSGDILINVKEKKYNFSLSISHCRDYATAVVIRYD